MNRNAFQKVAVTIEHPTYTLNIERQEPLYDRQDDIRTPFYRDYTRIIFSQAYRRLKHKTQVFFAVKNDHICTRIEHVNLVESTSYSIASYLGLNTELTKAIAVGHDLGHAPFGHGGEKILNQLAKKYDLPSFWHEKNSLRFVDDIELLEDDLHQFRNLNLTYAVRDGILSHCGEMHQKAIQPRKENIDLNHYSHPGQFEPFTYEGCVVKVSDKIAYLARDIEDALTLHILNKKQINDLNIELNKIPNVEFHAINNGTILNYLILDICHHSSPEKGISFSESGFKVVETLMKFNYQNIYLIPRVEIHNHYVELILHALFDKLLDYYHPQEDVCMKQLEHDSLTYPLLIGHFLEWLKRYNHFHQLSHDPLYKNHRIYQMEDKKSYIQAIIDYLSGMTDSYIIETFNEIISF